MIANDPIVRLQGVSCDLGGKRILEDVDLNLHQGEITVVLGPSGAGKSTLMRTIAGFEPVSAGDIIAPSGVWSSTTATRPPEQRSIGVVVQSNALFPHMTVIENVRFGMERSDAGSAHDWLAKVQLEDRANAYPHELSGGEQQRIALARALARQPDIVLLDEAFSSLDQQLRKSVRREAKSLLRDAGAAVLIVTHDPDEALEMADTIVVMSEGRILQQGSPQELFWQPASVVAARLLGEVNVLPGKWHDGFFHTAFGAIDCTSLPSKSASHALIRPSALSVCGVEQSAVRMIDSELLAGHRAMTISSESGDILRVSGHSDPGLKVNDEVQVTFDPDRIGWA